jgi:Leucine-rich repeat (LRR) protein
VLDYLLNGDETDPGLANLLFLNLIKCICEITFFVHSLIGLVLKKPVIKHSKLQSLFLSWTNIVDVEIQCPNLVTLDLSGVTTISGDTLKKILVDSGALLKHLWVQNSDVMTDEILQLVPLYCRKLQMLNVSSNKVITQAGIEHVASSKIFSCDSLIIVECKKLQRIYLNDCQISDWKYLSETYPQVIFTIRSLK